MRLLLDSHVFVWSGTADPRLSGPARAAIEDPDNERFLSVASSWELMIQAQRGKLRLPGGPVWFLGENVARLVAEILPIQQSHVLQLERIPLHHGDPFDRVLIAQCQVEGLAIVTADPAFALYDVDVIW
jgi:PIN domain nuclease of toxin-antitoxin system